MDEAKIIQNLKELKQIKPNKEWAILTKKEILGEEYKESRFSTIVSTFRFILQPKVLAPAVLTLLVGLFLFVQGSLPGDSLHSVKKIAEMGQETVAPNKTEFYLGIAEKRAQELNEIVAANQVEKLSPAIKEYQDSLKKAAQSIAENSKAPEETILLAQKVNKIKGTTEKLEKDLNIEIKEIKELKENILACLRGDIEATKTEMAVLAKREIESLRNNNSLTEEQQAALAEAEALFEAENYQGALGKIILLSYPREAEQE